MNCYTLSRLWFSFAYENTSVKPVHTALYFWIIERGNASGWKKIIDIQTDKSMECLGVTDWRTYKNALQFLADNNFIKWIEHSKNQYTCNRVSIVDDPCELSEAFKNASALNVKANAEAIAEAIVEAYAEADVEAIAEALQSYINLKTYKPSNLKTSKQSPPVENSSFDFLEKADYQVQKESLVAKEKKATHTGGAAPAKVEMPDLQYPFDTQKFRNAWQLWNDHRKNIRKPYKSMMSQQAALKQLSEFDEDYAIGLIERSIAGDYQGLVFPNTKEDYQKHLKAKQNGQSAFENRPNGAKPSFAGVAAIVDFMSKQDKF